MPFILLSDYVLAAIKNRLNIGKDPNLYFYRDQSQREVDLIHLKGYELQAYEIKSGKFYQSEYYKGIKYLKNHFQGQVNDFCINL